MKKFVWINGSARQARLCWLVASILVACSSFMTIRFVAKQPTQDTSFTHAVHPAPHLYDEPQEPTDQEIDLHVGTAQQATAKAAPPDIQPWDTIVKEQPSKITPNPAGRFVSVQMMDNKKSSASFTTEALHPLQQTDQSLTPEPTSVKHRKIIAKGASAIRSRLADDDPVNPNEVALPPLPEEQVAQSAPVANNTAQSTDAFPAAVEVIADESSPLQTTHLQITAKAMDLPQEQVIAQVEHQSFDSDTPEVMGWINVGYSSTDPADRHIGRALKMRGWASYIDHEVSPQLRWGVRRFMLHNPFGITDSSKAMPFSQYLEAKESGPSWVTDGFVDAWQRVVRGDYTDGEPVEVIGYIGSVTHNEELKALQLAGDLDAWNARAEASVAPLIEAGMSIAFDAGSLITADHPAYAFMLSLQNRGIKVYSEAYPMIDKPHLNQFPVIMLLRYDSVVRNHSQKFPKRSELAHRVTQIINGHATEEDDPDWIVNKTIATLVNGDNVMINVKWLIQEGWSKQRLMERIEMQRYAGYD